HNIHKLNSHDSMMFIVKEGNMLKCDSAMQIMVTVEAKDENVLIDIMEDGEKHFYKYNIDSDIDGDSIHMIIKTHMDNLDIEDIDKHMMKINGDDSHFIFVGDDGDIQVKGDGSKMVYKIKTMGTDGVEVVRDTIIEDGEHKIIIKTNRNGGSGY
ncbi:MAG: hypothetical protein B6D64_12895, partial [Bacteroidetes bacterium 4484_276]